MTKITRQQMIEKVEKNVYLRERLAKKARKGSFDEKGQVYRGAVARDLLRSLRGGGTPTPREVVAYFGKGARFAE